MHACTNSLNRGPVCEGACEPDISSMFRSLALLGVVWLVSFALTHPPLLPFPPQRGERGFMSRPYGVAQHAVTTQSPDSGKFPGHQGRECRP